MCAFTRAASLMLALGTGACSLAADAKPAASSQGVAVVELFTSEGCSSCPPADALLADMVRDARAAGRPVYPIAWHVDYWNHLGWADPFSSADASARQSAYARTMKTDDIYTPQLVVNGRAAFVGSNAAKEQAAVAQALAKPATATVALAVKGVDAQHVSVDYTVHDAAAAQLLEVVAVERGLSTHVARGENGGRELRHENVVRAATKIELDATGHGRATVTLPAGVDQSKASIIAFVQDPVTLAVSGASAADLPAH